MRGAAKIFFVLGLCSLVVVGACTKLPKLPGYQSPKDGDGERPWYERDTFEGVFGDFSKTDKLLISDPKVLSELRARGDYLANGSAACGSCHGAKPGDSKSALSGGRAMTDRFGVVHAANITADAETGIGQWTVLELMRAMRASIDRNGKTLSIDLHGGYRWMADIDARAIAIYLLASEPVKNPVERRVLTAFERNRWGIFPQHRDFAGYVPTITAKSGDQYGRYLAYHVARCQFCHTSPSGGLTGPDAFSGAQGSGDMSITQMAKALFTRLISYRPGRKEEPELGGLVSKEGEEQLGVEYQQEAEQVAADSKEVPDNLPRDVRERALVQGDFPVGGPDIRGNSSEGLLAWSTDDIVEYLTHGKTPDGEKRDGRFCPWPYFKRMSDEDKRAIAEYLKRI